MTPVRGDPKSGPRKGIQRVQRNNRTELWQVTEALLSGVPPQRRNFREGHWRGAGLSPLQSQRALTHAKE